MKTVAISNEPRPFKYTGQSHEARHRRHSATAPGDSGVCFDDLAALLPDILHRRPNQFPGGTSAAILLGHEEACAAIHHEGTKTARKRKNILHLPVLAETLWLCGLVVMIDLGLSNRLRRPCFRMFLQRIRAQPANLLRHLRGGHSEVRPHGRRHIDHLHASAIQANLV